MYINRFYYVGFLWVTRFPSAEKHFCWRTKSASATCFLHLPSDLILPTVYPCVLHVCKDKSEHLEIISLVWYSTVEAGYDSLIHLELFLLDLLCIHLLFTEVQNWSEGHSFSPAVQLHLAHAGLNLLKRNILKSSNLRAFKRYPVSVKNRGTR